MVTITIDINEPEPEKVKMTFLVDGDDNQTEAEVEISNILKRVFIEVLKSTGVSLTCKEQKRFERN